VITADEVMGALAGVRDPELDEPLTELGFVAGVDVGEAAVCVHLRLPTYFCAPNFAYLMVADAVAAVRRVMVVGDVTVRLEDHFASGEINAAIASGQDFAAAFPGESEGELEALRETFTRKAFVARQARICDRLLRAGRTHEEVAALPLGALEGDPERDRCVELRAALRIDVSPTAPAFVRGDGTALGAAELPRYMRVARLVALSLEGNAGLCRSMLATRYGIPDPQEAAA
jgi:metal-sulfur cluster biosynthetic enzyme